MADENVAELVRKFSHEPRRMKLELASIARRGWNVDQSGWVVTGFGYRRPVRASALKECTLAVRRGGHFSFVASYQCVGYDFEEELSSRVRVFGRNLVPMSQP
jgi:hypothetical protein